MQNLITTSGYTLIPPSGLKITLKSIQLDTIASSGNILISGSLGTYNSSFTAITPIVIDFPFLQGENVTCTPTSGLCVINYVYGGEPEAYMYGREAQAYSAASGIAPLWNSVVLSGSYQQGFGG